jgi:tetratricopeptide (TPR) repeat protein
VRAAERGVAVETNEFVAVPAARVFAAANHYDRAEALAAALERREQPLPRAYAHVIAGELALRRGHASQAIAAFSDAIKTADIWLARFDRGMAFVEAERYAEGLSDLELCLKRRGEATALFLDDVPTWRYMAVLPYWHGRAQQGLGMTEAARQNFEQFLRLESSSTPTPLIVDARTRATALKDAATR